MSEYSQGVCQDGAAVLKDGQPMSIEEILAELRARQTSADAIEYKQEPIAQVRSIQSQGSSVVVEWRTEHKLRVGDYIYAGPQPAACPVQTALDQMTVYPPQPDTLAVKRDDGTSPNGAKLHWFVFSFRGVDLDSGAQCNATSYAGYPSMEITLPEIKEQKGHAGVTAEAALVSVSYLGRMTRGEFTGDNDAYSPAMSEHAREAAKILSALYDEDILKVSPSDGMRFLTDWQKAIALLESAPQPDTIPVKREERAAFELKFPVPGGVFWNEYVEQYDGLPESAADLYHAQWQAWQARALLASPTKADELIPQTGLKSVGIIDLYDDEEPGCKEVVKHGLLLEFASRKAMAEAFDKGICRFSFNFEAPKEQDDE